jgi:hypothetical protein
MTLPWLSQTSCIVPVPVTVLEITYIISHHKDRVSTQMLSCEPPAFVAVPEQILIRLTSDHHGSQLIKLNDIMQKKLKFTSNW